MYFHWHRFDKITFMLHRHIKLVVYTRHFCTSLFYPFVVNEKLDSGTLSMTLSSVLIMPCVVIDALIMAYIFSSTISMCTCCFGNFSFASHVIFGFLFKSQYNILTLMMHHLFSFQCTSLITLGNYLKSS